MTWGNPTKTSWDIPNDAKVVATSEEWQIYHSCSQKLLYFYPTEYHAASLKLGLGDLKRLIRKLKYGSVFAPGRNLEDEPVKEDDPRKWFTH